MAITYDQLGKEVTTTGGVEKVTFDIDSMKDDGTFRSQPYSMQVTIHSGDFDYAIVKRDATAPTIDTPKWSGSKLNTPLQVPIIVFNAFNQDFYINSTAGSKFSITFA